MEVNNFLEKMAGKVTLTGIPILILLISVILLRKLFLSDVVVPFSIFGSSLISRLALDELVKEISKKILTDTIRENEDHYHELT